MIPLKGIHLDFVADMRYGHLPFPVLLTHLRRETPKDQRCTYVAMVQTRNVLAVMALLAGAISFAVLPDPRLLSLLPPESQIVAGAVAPLQERHRGNFLIFTRANTLDLEDFFSLVGAHPCRSPSVEFSELVDVEDVGMVESLP